MFPAQRCQSQHSPHRSALFPYVLSCSDDVIGDIKSHKPWRMLMMSCQSVKHGFSNGKLFYSLHKQIVPHLSKDLFGLMTERVTKAKLCFISNWA